MTVEFTAHPAWYAVQALPVVAHPQNEDALSWATAYYAHSLAAYIVKEIPVSSKSLIAGRLKVARRRLL